MTESIVQQPVASAQDINRFLSDTFGAVVDQCVDAGYGWATSKLTPGAHSWRPGAIINGPTVFAACDGALCYAVYTMIGVEPMAMTGEMSIRYLRPARGEALFARAEIHSLGRRSIVGTVVAWTDDPNKPAAVAQGTIVRPPAS
jgi:acyl-coenzyme A thioesterase PaaI-like protein